MFFDFLGIVPGQKMEDRSMVFVRKQSPIIGGPLAA
jgi:hypothetical protein